MLKFKIEDIEYKVPEFINIENYVNGEPHGYWEAYYSDGDLDYKGYFDMGEQVDYNPDEPKVIELTLTDIANKLGIDVDKLRIKD